MKNEELLNILKSRFENNMNRHKNLKWDEIEAKIEINSEKLLALSRMEETGGEPDVVNYDKKTKEYIFCDCSPESPKGRRNTCYDGEAMESRKKNKPKVNAIDMATEIGIKILTEKQYRGLQQLGKFDLKTSSWVETPTRIRELGGAIFCNRRYDTVFMYHNSAESYYGGRGFRGYLKI